jgi:predicted Zn-dependent peptidase
VIALLLALAGAEPLAPRAGDSEPFANLRHAVLVVVDRPGPPWVELRIAARGGSAADPDEKSGLAHVVALVLEKRLDALDARPIVHLGRHGIVASAGAPKDRIERLAVQVADALAKEASEPEVDAAVSRAADRRRRFVEDDRALAAAELDRALFGEGAGHPLGSVEEIAGVTRDDVQSFIRRSWTAENLRLILVGAVEDGARERIAARMARLERPAKAYAISPRKTVVRDGIHVVLIDKPDRRRATVVMGHAAARRPGDAEADAAIGGCASSALMARLSGLGAIDLVESELSDDRFLVRSSVDPPAIARATIGLIEALRGIEKSGLSAEDALLGQRSIETARALARRDARSEADALAREWLVGATGERAPSSEALGEAAKALAAQGPAIVIVGSATPSLQSELLAIPGVKNVEVVRYDLR